MNGIRPTVGIEFDDKYTNAKNKLIELVKALDELTDTQRAQLAQEYITSYSMATSLEQFISYMKKTELTFPAVKSRKLQLRERSIRMRRL